MKIIYRANDGKEFADPKDCVVYEQQKVASALTTEKPRPEVRGWDTNGELLPVEELDGAYVVCIGNKEGANLFIQQCNDSDTSYSGIYTNSEGYFVWSHNSECFVKWELDDLETVYNWFRKEHI